MVQVIKRTKVKGEVHEHKMSFSDNEWALLKQHYPYGGVSFHLEGEEDVKKEKPLEAKAGRVKDDDKPNMKDYNELKEMANNYFRDENWDKALYYYEAMSRLKAFPWVVGKISRCKKNARALSLTKPKIEGE